MDGAPESMRGRASAPGALIAGKYRLVRRLGEGGMGVVWEAVHEATRRRVAIKVLGSEAEREGSTSDLSKSVRQKREEMVRRFEREARSTGVIDSEHVVQILDAGTDAETGRPFLVMELLAGEDLQSIGKRIGPISPKLALRIAAQTSLGLATAHEAGIVHRDIKMANLFLVERADKTRTVKLLDFGIAKIILDEVHAIDERGLTRTGSMLGSPYYMSPEQAQGLKSIDHRTDLWSLGIVLYKSLTGFAPFEADSFGQLILAICSDKPQPIRDVAPWVSEGTAAIVHRALRKDPRARFQSAREMFDAIATELPDGWDIHEDMIEPIPEEQRATIRRRQRIRPSNPPTLTEGELPARFGSSTRTETGITTTSRAARRSPRLVPVGVLAAVLGVASWLALRSPRASSAPQSAVPPSAAAESARTTTPPAESAAEPATRSAKLEIQPANASVTVDGASVEVRGDAIEITGTLGSTHKVQLKLGSRERAFDVVIAEQGTVPASVALELAPSAVASPARAPRAPERPSRGPETERAAPAPSPAPASTAVPAAASAKQGVRIRDAFE